MGVSWNRGTPKSFILMGVSLIISHPFWGSPIYGNLHIAADQKVWLHLFHQLYHLRISTGLWHRQAREAMKEDEIYEMLHSVDSKGPTNPVPRNATWNRRKRNTSNTESTSYTTLFIPGEDMPRTQRLLRLGCGQKRQLGPDLAQKEWRKCSIENHCDRKHLWGFP